MKIKTMKIRTRYFAILKEQAGRSEEVVSTQAGTAGELYDELAKKHGFTLGKERLSVSVNEEFQELTTPLSPEDRVVFVPPVAGG